MANNLDKHNRNVSASWLAEYFRTDLAKFKTEMARYDAEWRPVLALRMVKDHAIDAAALLAALED